MLCYKLSLILESVLESTGINVHKLQLVERDLVIVPESMLTLLDRDVIQFVLQRARLAQYQHGLDSAAAHIGRHAAGSQQCGANPFLQACARNLDAVITSSPEVVRCEGFSGCCGIYASADIPAAMFDREISGRGTTNVGLKTSMPSALGRLRTRKETGQCVGRERVELTYAR